MSIPTSELTPEERADNEKIFAAALGKLAEAKSLISRSRRLDATSIGKVRMLIWDMEGEVKRLRQEVLFGYSTTQEEPS
jgi:hypothetical protein